MLQNFDGCLRRGKPVHFRDCLEGKVHGGDLEAVACKLTRVVAALCRDANDYEGAFTSFYQQLQELRLGQAMPDRRADFVAAAEAVLRPFVEESAAAIPIGDSSEFEGQWRQERIASIVCLAAYEGWARHERRKADL